MSNTKPEQKLILRLRTRDDLTQLLKNGESPAWRIAKEKEKQIATVEIVNWDGTIMLAAPFDVSKSRRNNDNRLIVGFVREKAAIVNLNTPLVWIGQNSVNYFPIESDNADFVLVHSSGKSFPVNLKAKENGYKYYLGRWVKEPNPDIDFSDFPLSENISRSHTYITLATDANNYSIVDDNSTNSTRLNGNCKVDYYLHTASRYITNILVSNQISLLVIGQNEGWKQNINIGDKNNQNFVNIPHSRFVEQLTYKCQLAGIEVKTVNENYTSKCSFLDLEPIQKHSYYVGKRVKRGLFKASSGYCHNADIGASLNIGRKVVGEVAFSKDSIERFVVNPVRIKAYKETYGHKCP